MKRHTLMIGKHQYEVDYIEFLENSEYSTSNYVVFRKFELINDLPHDTDFYIISKDSLNKWINSEKDIVWPYISSSGIPLQSSDPGYFITSLTKENSLNACYDIYDNEANKLLNIKEDTIRIWHPQTKPVINATIYIQSVVNNIRFHLLGDLILPSISTNVSKEWRKGHGIYSEYIDYKIPSLKYLFNNGYWYDNLSNNISNTDKNIIYKKDKQNPTVTYYIHTAISNKPNVKLLKTVDSINLDIDYHEYWKNYYLFIELGVSIDNGKTIYWNHQGDESTEGYNSVLTSDIVSAISCKLEGIAGIEKGEFHIYPDIINGNFLKVELYIPENSVNSNDESFGKVFIYNKENLQGTEEKYSNYEEDNIGSSVANSYYGINSGNRYGTFSIYIDNENLSTILNKLQPSIENNEYLIPKTYKPTIITKVLTQTEYELLSNEAKEKCSYGEDGKWIYEDIQITGDIKIATPFGLVTYPYQIVESNGIFSKKYINKYQDIKSWNTIISITPYTGIDENTSLYIQDEDLPSSNAVFVDESKFQLKSRIGFINGEISIINEWEYPMKNIFDSFKESYEYVNDVKFSEYENFVPKDLEDIEEDEELEKLNERSLCYFKCDVATSKDMKYIIWTKAYNGTTPDDFSIGLREIFNSWDEVPDTICIRVQFIDKYIGQMFNSPIIVVLKEKIKYMINDLFASRVNLLLSKQELNKKYNVNWIYQKYNKNIEMNIENFNFIDNIRCIVKNDKSEDSTIIQRNNNIPRVIYKPIFYKISELQNINITSGYTQNIGINLKSLMTKVNMFTLIIENNQFTEFARNDVYVIFKIDPSNLSNSTGKYHIIDDNDEYISSGTYNIIN